MRDAGTLARVSAPARRPRTSRRPPNLSAENTSGGLVPDTQQFSVTAGPSS